MLQDWIWLTTRKALGPRGVLRVLEYFGTPERAFYAEPEQYDQIPELPAAARASLREKGMDEADRILGECDRLGLRVMTLQDGDYPGRLREISAPPAVLYIRGRVFRFDERRPSAWWAAGSPLPMGSGWPPSWVWSWPGRGTADLRHRPGDRLHCPEGGAQGRRARGLCAGRRGGRALSQPEPLPV